MKTMVERNEVLHRYRVQQQSKRQILREMSMSRHTVDKIVCEYERECLDAEGNCDMGALERLEGRKPAFRTPARPYRVVSGPMLELLRQCLEQNKVRRATGQRKLQWNCRNMHSLLLSKGYSVSYPSVCVHVRRLKAGAQADPCGLKTTRDAGSLKEEGGNGFAIGRPPFLRPGITRG